MIRFIHLHLILSYYVFQYIFQIVLYAKDREHINAATSCESCFKIYFAARWTEHFSYLPDGVISEDFRNVQIRATTIIYFHIY